jgi:hypothetical protein
MTIMRDALIQSRRKNIERYLATNISFDERRHFHKRIAQERAELERLQLQAFRASRKADVATVVAAQALQPIDGSKSQA